MCCYFRGLLNKDDLIRWMENEIICLLYNLDRNGNCNLFVGFNNFFDWVNE